MTARGRQRQQPTEGEIQKDVVALLQHQVQIAAAWPAGPEKRREQGFGNTPRSGSLRDDHQGQPKPRQSRNYPGARKPSLLGILQIG